MTEPIIYWPRGTLKPATLTATLNPFSRAGSRSLGGINRAVVTDLGYWTIGYGDVSLRSPPMRRTWNAIRTASMGRAGLISVPAWSFDSAPYASGAREPVILTPNSDGSPFSDGADYSQGAISVLMKNAAAIGDTVVTLTAINAGNLVGVRFSYSDALYETGPAISIDGADWQVPIFPAIRAPISAASNLECDNPTCLCRLATDAAMDGPLNNTQVDTATVNFIEATDYWVDLALGL